MDPMLTLGQLVASDWEKIIVAIGTSAGALLVAAAGAGVVMLKYILPMMDKRKQTKAKSPVALTDCPLDGANTTVNIAGILKHVPAEFERRVADIEKRQDQLEGILKEIRTKLDKVAEDTAFLRGSKER